MGASTLSAAQIGGYWKQADPTSSDDLTVDMTAIAFAESSGNPGSIQQGQPYSTTGWGLWQITPGNSEPSVGTDHDLLEPGKNAQAAYLKYKAGGLHQWTTYTSGAYRKFLQSANDARGDWGTGNAIDSPSNSTATPETGIPGANQFGSTVEHDLSAGSFLYDLGQLFFTEKGWMRLLKIAAGVIIGVIAIKALFADLHLSMPTFPDNAGAPKGKGLFSLIKDDPEVLAA